MTPSPGEALERLIEVCRRLLDDETGCPWDREQTLATITPYLQEETFEILDAIAARDDLALGEEMGDLLYLLVFAAALGEREGRATGLAAILSGACDKLVRRHPHVFGATALTGPGAALRQWEEIKRDEKNADTTLGHRPPGLPALTTAFRIQEKAAAVRFEWADFRGAMDKLHEEIEELKQVLDDPAAPPGRVADEIGDILYSVVNLSRYLRVDPEQALRGTIMKFMNRFRFIESVLAERGRTPAESSLEEMDALWNEAKARGIR